MPPGRRPQQSDWTTGPAGWAPIVALTLLATVGSLGAASSHATKPHTGFVESPIADSRINVNTASGARLQLLPRIGPKMAERIIEERQTIGPFEDAKDIQRVRGIGPRTAQRIAEVADFTIDR